MPGKKWLVAPAGALWLALAACWLLTVSGGAPPPTLSRLVALLAGAATLAAVAAWAWATATAGDARRRRAGRLLLAILALALVVRFAGIDHEVAERFYADEGYYTKHATEINAGSLLVPSFHYPHLLYYLDAFAIWVASLFDATVLGLTGLLFGIDDWGIASRLINRLLVALFGALTVVPVFRIGERLAGTAAGAFGGALIAASTVYNEGSHLAICDVPSAFFAAATLAGVARLLDEERTSTYVWAGVCAGLAAGTKYPAGLVAVAICAVWLRGRIAGRRFSLDLLWSGLAAIGAFVASTPGLVVLPEVAFGRGRRSIFWGALVYSGEGWVGVTPPSNSLYYLGLLTASWGLPALAIGLAGLFLLARRRLVRVIWLTPFPIAYMALILSMSVAVPRNIYPVLPALAMIAGCGAAGLWARTAGRFRAREPDRDRAAGGVRAPAERRWLGMGAAGAAVVVLVLAWPAGRTLLQAVAFSRPGTRVQAKEWIREHVPRGAIVLKEVFTPDLPEDEYVVRPARDRFIGRTPIAELTKPEIDLLVLSSGAWGRFFEPQRQVEPDLEEVRARYREVFDTFPLLASFEPGPLRLGPVVRIHRVRRDELPIDARRTLTVDYVFVPDPARIDWQARRVLFTAEGDWCQVKGFFEAGPSALQVQGEVVGTGGRVTVRSLDNREVAMVELNRDDVALFELREPGKYFFYIELPPGSHLRRVTIGSLPG